MDASGGDAPPPLHRRDGGGERAADRRAAVRHRARRGNLLFVVTFGLGLGPVAWLLPAELFPMGKRAAANGVATGANWLANFAVGQLFLLVAGALGPLAFIPFGAILAAGFLFAWRFIPETRGRTLEQIEAMMRKER